jgi:outer membrane protein OmpA-like peptidoglycan-associated protein
MTSTICGRTRYLAFLSLLLIAALAAAQQDEDKEGSIDHKITGRYQGSYIEEYSQKEYEEVRFLKPPLDAGGNGAVPLTDAFSIPLAGRATTIVYRGPNGRSILEVLKNYIDRLSGAGFTTVAKCRGVECGLNGNNQYIQRLYFRGARAHTRGSEPIISSDRDLIVYTLLQKKSSAGDVWVSLYGSEFQHGGNLTPSLAVSVLETKPMETGKMVFVDAASMQEAMEKTGRVALYGIYFDSNKAVLKAESAKQIAEIARLLKTNPKLKVLVVGHTDNQGGFDFNMGLSEQRADAVIGALTTRHAIPAARLTPVGVGMASPVDTNRSSEGRAKNRRVEIVEY